MKRKTVIMSNTRVSEWLELEFMSYEKHENYSCSFTRKL